jgi:hypothetical protein
VNGNDRLKEISLAYRKTGEWMKPTNDETGTIEKNLDLN